MTISRHHIKSLLLYVIAFLLLLIVLLYYNKTYQELTKYSELSDRQHTLHNCFQSLSRHINNAAILNPDLIKANNSANTGNLFFTDSLQIIQNLDLLKATVIDSINTQIAESLDTTIRTELSWFLRSNIPEAIVRHKFPGHIASFRKMDSLINQGIQRTSYLIEYGKKQLNREINTVRTWMVLFILLSGILLIYTTINLFRQQDKRKGKELEAVFNRISDGVVSVDNDWRYTFLNDAAMATHPLGKQETLGKVIWEVHPEMKGTLFWDKYHEAMRTKKVVEIENYYPPMDIWFSVKVYPSGDGLTIFYKNVTESKGAQQRLSQTVKEVTDYKFALDESSIVAITDQKGIIKHANENFCKISKYPVDELIGQDHRIINSGYHPKEFIRNLWVTIANGKIWKGELKNKAKDGTIYWVDTTIVPFLNEEGKPYQYVAIRSDITERKKLEERQALFASIVNSSNDAIISKDLDGIIISWNHGAETVFGYSAEEITGKHISILIPPHLQNEESSIMEKIRKGNGIDHYETERARKDGKIINVSLTISPIKDSLGKIIGASKISRDITDRKKIEENLQKSLKEIADYKYALDESSIVAITDQKGTIKYVNDNFCKISKYSAQELIGQDHRIINSGHHSKEFIKNLWITIANGEIWQGELKNKAKDGTIYWVDTTIVPFLDDKGKPYQYVAIRADITERKQAQRNIIELNRSLEEKVIIRTEQLRKANEELEAFSYSVSHDLRAPLRGIIGFTAILEEDYASKLDDEARRITSIIKSNTIKMGNLIDDLLTFSRMGRQEISKTNIDTNMMVNEIIDDFDKKTGDRDIEWIVHPLPVISGDNGTIRQVWINFISNAIKYSRDASQPRIEIGSFAHNGQTTFFIKDNGVGFDQQYKEKLFKVFQRLHSADEFEGTGVGLALIEKIISKHGGRVWATGEVDKGATFNFSLPVDTKKEITENVN